MLDMLGEANAAALIGLLGGVLLGMAARIGRFCTLGAIEDVLYGNDGVRLRMWGIAIGTAILGAHLAMSLGMLEARSPVYLDRVWNPTASIIGGLIFGYGMALSGNCGFGALARLGGGDLRSLVIVLVMGLSAYFVMSGPLATLRVELFPVELQADKPQGVSELFQTQFGVPLVVTGAFFGVGLIALSLWGAEFHQFKKHLFWGAIVGFAIVSGWIGTEWIAQNGFGNEPVETHSFAAPVGDVIYYGMTASGTELSFSVGSVIGVVFGSFLGSWSQGHLRWEACEDPRELRRQMFGAALMGIGAILAVGCSVGQGLAAFSVLAFSAPLVLACIFAGAAIGLKQLITGFSLAE